jgi:CDP-6-deoxy-L-threo-D-glycero-4-hexulose-3-dehydrase reductase
MPHITVNPSQTQFDAQENETILAAALRHQINLPHACQSGVCGTCVATVVSGSVKPNEQYDDYVLSQEQIDAGAVLLCCCQAESDVVLEMPSYAGAKAIAVRTLPAKIASIELMKDVAILKITLPKAPPFVFYAGQYMEILLKDGSRSYSIANAPHQQGELEFHVRLREGGLFSPQLFSGSLKAGSVIRLRGPFGAFYLNEGSDKDLIFLATGTGFAPVQSMLQHLAYTQPNRAIHVYRGGRFIQDLYDENQLLQILKQLPNAKYTPVLSRQNENWTGKIGYLADQVLRDYPDLTHHEVYACGSPDMVRDSKRILTQKAKLPETAFYSDAFTAHT